MKLIEMKKLIEKYFEGTSTLEEESRLRDYFNGPNVEEALKQYQPLFNFFEAEQKASLGADFDQRLMAGIEGQGRIVSMHSWKRRLLQVAAVGVILIGAFVFLKKPITHSSQTAINWEKYETTDTQLAYEQTKEALKLLSSKLKKGSQRAVDEVAKTEKVSKYLN